MAVPVGNFVVIGQIVQLAVDQGCEERETKIAVALPSGQRTVRYLYNPKTGGTYDISDYEDGEFMAPSCIRAAERRLGINLPK